MAKIDVSKIEGYESLTPEQKIAALEGYEFTSDTTDADKLKNALTKANSEAAEWKRKHNALLSEDERKEAERKEATEAIQAELEGLRKEKSVLDNKAKFLALGYDTDLASETAKALADGNLEKVFENQKAYIESVKKTERASALAGTPQPPAGKVVTSDEKEKQEINALRKVAGLQTT